MWMGNGNTYMYMIDCVSEWHTKSDHTPLGPKLLIRYHIDTAHKLTTGPNDPCKPIYTHPTPEFLLDKVRVGCMGIYVCGCVWGVWVCVCVCVCVCVGGWVSEWHIKSDPTPLGPKLSIISHIDTPYESTSGPNDPYKIIYTHPTPDFYSIRWGWGVWMCVCVCVCVCVCPSDIPNPTPHP